MGISLKSLKLKKSKVVKVPIVMQMEMLECGAASLCMILAYYEKWIPLSQVRFDCGVNRDGSNAKNMLLAAKSYGLESRAYKYEPEELKEYGTFPCIIHWNFNHFVVCCGFRGNKVYINDPARGRVIVTEEEFDKSFTGICMEFEPTESFEKGGMPKSMLEYASTKLKGTHTAIIFLTLMTVITSLIGLLYPAFSRFFMDQLLGARNTRYYYAFMMLLFVVGMVEIIASCLSDIFSLRINGKMAVSGSTSYMWKVLTLPMEFFSQRMAGDIQMRRSSNELIARQMVEMVTPLLIDAVMMVFYVVVMIRYSPLMTFVGIISIIINLLVARLISKKRVNITRVLMRDRGKLQGTTVSGIEIMESIKASGAENGFFEKWSGFQASVNTQTVNYILLDMYLGVIPSIVLSFTNAIVLILGVYYAMFGNFTVGMIMAFQTFLLNFTNPAMRFIQSGQQLQEMRTQMERLDDVMNYPSQEYSVSEDENTSYAKLSGELELKNVTFGYSRLAEPLIVDFNLNLKPGKSVAFVGSSGCGKSTLSKLISGLYKQWDGEIFFDGKPINEIDRAVFTGSLAVVDQEITLFEDSIADNIKMWDRSIEDFEMILAARDAKMHEDIIMRDGGYNYRMHGGGNDFSGGQRQRLEIARVLAQDPTIVILDEATSALDAKTEYEVVKAIKDRGVTCIIVAHRLSTIRDCDEIIVLDKGKVVERGTHEELMEKGTQYKKLITAE